MKNARVLILILLTFFSFSQAIGQTYKIDVASSTIKWQGKKITGQHEGTVNFKDGYLVFKNKKLAGGNFTVDMKTLANTDQTGSSKTKLEGHLKSEDFFSVDNYTTSNLVFKSIAAKGPDTYLINADLTIKGITNPIQFDLQLNGKKATANLEVNRTKYDIKYGSGSYFDDLGDKTIYDDFELEVSIAY